MRRRRCSIAEKNPDALELEIKSTVGCLRFAKKTHTPETSFLLKYSWPPKTVVIVCVGGLIRAETGDKVPTSSQYSTVTANIVISFG